MRSAKCFYCREGIKPGDMRQDIPWNEDRIVPLDAACARDLKRFDTWRMASILFQAAESALQDSARRIRMAGKASS